MLQRTPPTAAPELLVLIWYSVRGEASVNIERGSLCPEKGVAPSAVEAPCVALLFLYSGCGGTSVFRFRLHLCLASQILPFRIFCDGKAVRLGRDPCGEANSLINDGREESHTSEGIRQPHQSPEYILVRV